MSICKKLFLGLFFITTVLFASHEETAIIVCEHGLEMYAHDLEFVRHAKESIEFSTPYFGGKILRELLTTIEERMKEVPELKVHVLAAPLFLEDRDEDMLQSMVCSYPERFHIMMSTEVPSRSPDLTAYHNHVKVFIVDEYYFAVGGTNLDEGLCTDGSYTPQRKTKDVIAGVKLPAGARDGDIVGRGKIAKELRAMFFNLYALWEEYDKTKVFQADPNHFAKSSRYFPIGEDKPYSAQFEESEKLVVVDKIKMVFSGPWQQPGNDCTEEYIRLLNSAKKSVTLGNLYFCPVPHLLDSLKNLVNRGVELTLILNGVHEGVTPDYNTKFCWANRIHHVPMFYGRDFYLWEASTAASMQTTNCRIYEYYVFDVVYHKKVMVVDDDILVVGCYNLGRKSDIADYELILVIESEKATRQAKEIFGREIALSREVTPEEARGWYFDPVTFFIGGAQRLVHGIL